VATYPIIPSLSRWPSMDSSKSTEDDTIKDQAELGYVSTRPRFTRSRRTWKINIRNLVAEDLRVLDEFVQVTAQRGANSFLYPNLLPNGSFELPASNSVDLVDGWFVSGVPSAALALSVALSGAVDGVPTGNVDDGLQAIQFATVAGQTLAPGASILAALDTAALINCSPGEQYLFHCRYRYTQGDVCSFSPQVCMVCDYDYGTETVDGSAGQPIGTSGWTDFWSTFTIPSGANTGTRDFRFRVAAAIANSTGAAIATTGGAIFGIDEVSCALLTAVQPWGRMVGSQPLGVPVRFSKLPEASDIGWGNGCKRYGVNFELTEV
jgi:hypothetical protein